MSDAEQKDISCRHARSWRKQPQPQQQQHIEMDGGKAVTGAELDLEPSSSAIKWLWPLCSDVLLGDGRSAMLDLSGWNGSWSSVRKNCFRFASIALWCDLNFRCSAKFRCPPATDGKLLLLYPLEDMFSPADCDRTLGLGSVEAAAGTVVEELTISIRSCDR
uniref:Uncharacterized protein n=1 Tax=Anopheles melas TaxID=34690 RepID=A0A182TKZ7_9DIPT